MTVTDAPSAPGQHRPSVAELRHRAEDPLLVMAAILTIAGIAAAVWAAAGGVDIPGWAQAALIGLIAPLLAGLVFIRLMYWTEISNAVEITPHQLPDIHATFAPMRTRWASRSYHACT